MSGRGRPQRQDGSFKVPDVLPQTPPDHQRHHCGQDLQAGITFLTLLSRLFNDDNVNGISLEEWINGFSTFLKGKLPQKILLNLSRVFDSSLTQFMVWLIYVL